MEWLTGLALLPALVCGVMMGGMALAGVLGWRRTQTASAGPDPSTTPTDTAGDATAIDDSNRRLEDARR